MNNKIYFLILALLLPLESCEKDSATNPVTGGGQKSVTVNQADPSYYETADGSAWIPVMINYLPPDYGNKLGADSPEFTVIEDYFQKFSANGGNSMRIWISTSFLEIEDQQEGVYDSLKFERIDKLLDLAKEYNIRIKFTLQHIRTIIPNNSNWDNSKSLATAFSSIEDYMNTPKGRDSYLRRVIAIANRYKDNPQIFGWELWNEVDASAWDNWEDFTAYMLPQVKFYFPNQLVTQTLGSLDSEEADTHYRNLFAFKNNDYISLHRYLDRGTDLQQYDLVKGSIDTLVSTAVSFAKQYVGNKPIVVDEIGAVEPDHASASRYYAIDKQGVLIHDMIFAPFFCGAAGTGAMWHWDNYIYPNNLWYHYQRFNNAIAGIDPVKEQMKPFTSVIDGVNCYGLKGKTKTIVWCRDSANNWETELAKGIAPAPKTGWSFQTEQMTSGAFSSVRFYDPWTDTWSDGSINNGTVQVPAFTRSIIIVLS